MIRTSVVICTYTPDRWDELCAAVASVQCQTVAASEVIVVVDHHDGLLQRARAELPVDQVIPNRSTQGLSGARNTGLGVAGGEIVAFLDDDATADGDWLRHLVEPYARDEVMGVGGLVVPNWAAPPPRWFPAQFGWVVGCSYEGLPTGLEPIRNPIGANMSFRRMILADAGGFATGIGRVGTRPMGCEETEAAIRMARHHPSRVILHQPKAVVHHVVPASRARWSYFRQRCWAEGLSKAEVARLADPRRALASERRYLTHTIPQGLIRDLGAAVRHRDRAGLGRAAVMVAGVTVAGSGYAVGRLREAHRIASRHPTDPKGLNL